MSICDQLAAQRVAYIDITRDINQRAVSSVRLAST